jgi:hypothetical protein
MKNPLPPRLTKFPAVKQRRMDKLLEKNSNGTITPKERATLEQLVTEAEQLMVANAKRLAEKLNQKQAAQGPAGAVPVTVWVQAEHAGR